MGFNLGFKGLNIEHCVRMGDERNRWYKVPLFSNRLTDLRCRSNQCCTELRCFPKAPVNCYPQKVT